MKHPRIPFLFSFVGVLLLGACASNEDKIVGKWTEGTAETMNEGGVVINLKIDGERNFLANGKGTAEGDLIVTSTEAGRLTFTYLFSFEWEVKEDDLFETITNATIVPVDVPDQEIATAFANLIAQGSIGYTTKYEILELTDKRLRIEDEDGFEEKLRRKD